MTYIKTGNATALSAHSSLNECHKRERGKRRVLCSSAKASDEQIALADTYGYGSMNVHKTIEVFKTNKENIDKLVPEVARKAAEAKIAWDELTPWLCRQRALLSQRGSDRREVLKRADLPEWKPYFKTVIARINSTISTVYYHMRQLEGAKAGTGRKPKPHLLTPLEQKLVDAAVAAHDVVKAYRCPGANVNEVIQKFEQVAPSPEKLVEITSKRKPQQPEPQSSQPILISQKRNS